MTDRKAEVLPPRSVGVLGAGTMGAGMALTFALAGSSVQVVSRRKASLEKARRRMGESLAMLERYGMGPAGGTEAVLARIAMTTAMDELDPDAELILETIAEDLNAKRALLATVDGLSRHDSVVATNTSSLPLADLQAVMTRPERFAGFHWFNPPELVRLVEVVYGPATATDTVDQLRAWSQAVGKDPTVITRQVEGFVANRLQYALIREAYALVEAGVCSIADVDRAVTSGLGPRWAAVGPFETLDLAGLDVHREVARRLFPALAADGAPPALLDQLVGRGALGCKAGQGLYGAYSPREVQRLMERRAAVMLAVASVVDRLRGEKS